MSSVFIFNSTSFYLILQAVLGINCFLVINCNYLWSVLAFLTALISTSIKSYLKIRIASETILIASTSVIICRVEYLTISVFFFFKVCCILFSSFCKASLMIGCVYIHIYVHLCKREMKKRAWENFKKKVKTNLFSCHSTYFIVIFYNIIFV